MMLPKLMLDENISPSLVAPLWEQEVDAIHVRDRDLLQAEDHVLWRYAGAEARAIVTINKSHFIRLAKNSIVHPGVVAIPSGGNRDEQFNYIMTAAMWAQSANYPGSAFANRFVEVSVTLELNIEDMTMASGATLEQKYLC
jgi:predicted nuclease of predicted toxin-antitoxin system